MKRLSALVALAATAVTLATAATASAFDNAWLRAHAQSAAANQCNAKFPRTCHGLQVSAQPVIGPTSGQPYYTYLIYYKGWQGSSREIGCKTYASVKTDASYTKMSVPTCH